jgi:hypothetical protein
MMPENTRLKKNGQPAKKCGRPQFPPGTIRQKRFVVRASDKFFAWADEFADWDHSTTSALFEAAVIFYANKRGYKVAPPQR